MNVDFLIPYNEMCQRLEDLPNSGDDQMTNPCEKLIYRQKQVQDRPMDFNLTQQFSIFFISWHIYINC